MRIKSFLLTADLHLRPDKPTARLDADWILTQQNLLDFIQQEANKRDVPVVIVGDVFDASHVSDLILTMFFNFCNNVKAGVVCLAGNHDLPYHSWANKDNSSFGVYWHAFPQQDEHFDHFGFWSHWGTPIRGNDTGNQFIHTLVFKSKKDMPPNVHAKTAQDLLDEAPAGVNWIFTGDMHRTFVYQHLGRFVVNPGCPIRQTADLVEYVPVIYFINTSESIVTPIKVPEDGELITDEYLRKEEAREERIEAFVESIHNAEALSLDFKANTEDAIMKSKDLDPAVEAEIRNLLEATYATD